MTLVMCIVMSSDSSLPRSDHSDNEALREPSTSEYALKTEKLPGRRR